MRCAWNELLCLLPQWMRTDVDRLGKNTLQELRLRKGLPPALIRTDGIVYLDRKVKQEDIQFCINAASQYSPWTTASISQGYLSTAGGHRIGLCGEVVRKQGQPETMRNIRSLCIRVARDIPGIGRGIPVDRSILILGAPGWGKTTLLRDIIRCRSEGGMQVAVVDERGELFPSEAFPIGNCTDILTGCPKEAGIHMLLRTMGPTCIAVDEITQPEDCAALIRAAGCGVLLLATAHAADIEDLRRRNVYKPLLESGIFTDIILLRPDKSWHMERV